MNMGLLTMMLVESALQTLLSPFSFFCENILTQTVMLKLEAAMRMNAVAKSLASVYVILSLVAVLISSELAV